MTKSRIVLIVIVLALVASVFALVMMNGNGHDDGNDESPTDPTGPITPSEPSKKLTIRNELQVGDWVTVTIPCKPEKFVVTITVDSIEGDVANVSVNCDETVYYYQALDHLKNMKRVWKDLERNGDKAAGLYSADNDESVPMYALNWDELKPAMMETIGQKTVVGNAGDIAVESLVTEGLYLTPKGNRDCIIYNGSPFVSMSEYLQYENHEDFDYEEAVIDLVLDKEMGIMWAAKSFGPIRLDSSVYEWK